MTTNMTTKRELNIDALNMVAGGSIFNRESSITEAGIELWEVYGEKRGEFGNFYNSGDYYFKGERIDQDQIDVLEYYYRKIGEVAPSLKEAEAYYNKNFKQKKRYKKL